jgi:hypothetical protein
MLRNKAEQLRLLNSTHLQIPRVEKSQSFWKSQDMNCPGTRKNIFLRGNQILYGQYLKIWLLVFKCSFLTQKYRTIQIPEQFTDSTSLDCFTYKKTFVLMIKMV